MNIIDPELHHQDSLFMETEPSMIHIGSPQKSIEEKEVDNFSNKVYAAC